MRTRYWVIGLLALLAAVKIAHATGSLAIPNTFQTQSGNVLVSQLDTNFTTIRDYVNNREITQGTLGARPAAGTAGAWYFATDTVGGTLYADNGTAWVQVAPASSSIVNAQGNAQLTFNSATQIQLGTGQIPLLIGGVWTMRNITTPITISNTGLVASTVYYVYASDTAGNTALTLTQTGHVANASFGVEVLNAGGGCCTLVGLLKTDASGQFVSSASHALVNSYFNRYPLVASASFATNRSTTSTSPVEIDTEIRNEWVMWASQTVTVGCSMTVNNAAGDAATTSIGIDSATTPEQHLGVFQSSAASNSLGGAIAWQRLGLAEGYHFAALLGNSTSGGSATWNSDGVSGRWTNCTVGVH